MEVEALLARGMRQGYVDVQDELPYVRGRIQFASSARCVDAPGTCGVRIHRLPSRHAGEPSFEGDARGAWSITAAPGTASASDGRDGLAGRCDACPAHSATVFRRPADEAECSLPLGARPLPSVPRGRAVEQPTGEVPAPAFLFPMEQVFEAADRHYLAVRRSDLRIQPERSADADQRRAAATRSLPPDLVVGKRGPLLVLDTKYANPERQTQFGTRSFRNNDLTRSPSTPTSTAAPACSSTQRQNATF